MMRKQNRGMTLVEILMAVSILAFVVLPVLGLLNYSNRGTREQDAEGIAANLAKEQMNRLMYVVSRDNLLDGAGAPQPWALGEHVVKGNVFSGEYTVFPWDSGELDFSVPKFKFHDPQLCAGGVESSPGTALDAADSMSLADVYPDSAGECRMVDIILVVKWHLPSTDFDPRNQFQLVARRAFLVEE